MDGGQEMFEIKVSSKDFQGVAILHEKERRRPRRAISKKKISLYKTEICKSFETSNFCAYGDKCQFAHSLEELRDVERHPRYKTELCKTYTTQGSCSYGKRCCFIHAGPKGDKDTDLQDARNLPGDWKTPGVADTESDSLEMNEISVEETIKTLNILTEEESEKLQLLSKFKVKTSFQKQRHSFMHPRPSEQKEFVTTKHSSSLMWIKAHMCFIFVDTGSKIIAIKPLGKAPGSVTLGKALGWC
ncbi:hypothetical protein NEDG_00951 [Nematocida displodere]|uniref:C3H1-type domain-containing protein n=1 Tax=Nematocida displodere TaxID=1805483 RepID=A0A177ECC0_9MICR|nr:hypothetical protein NEDG_00951 [Nematocida displodere]